VDLNFLVDLSFLGFFKEFLIFFKGFLKDFLVFLVNLNFCRGFLNFF